MTDQVERIQSRHHPIQQWMGQRTHCPAVEMVNSHKELFGVFGSGIEDILGIRPRSEDLEREIVQ